ncbi:MAG: iron-containing alcohol dehydrogenase [Clostridia bacterium]|nr:iron-containing alcohol dehydrogenase [Clostridia bacterium]
MSSVLELINSLKGPCSCGMCHETAIKDIVIESGAVNTVGEILKRNGFPKNLLLVADKNTIKAADGIVDSLKDFDIEFKIYDTLRVATMKEVNELEELIKDKEIGVLSVGTGSINDPCRLAAARQDKLLCIFATAPSMDGFASYGAPIVDKGFKFSYSAKSPEVIIGDTKILASAPSELKSAGFGDMIAKYVGLVDWKISSILTDEIYCERVAKLTRDAVDELVELADKVTVNDEKTAGKIFEALLKTGVGMSFMKNSRPASGAEHIVAHILECKELVHGIIPNYHGHDVGVSTLNMLKYYGMLASKEKISAKYENVDWDDVYAFYGNLADDVRDVNFPDNIIDGITPESIEENWEAIRNIIREVPSYEECKEAMIKAGCKITVDDIGKDRKLFNDCTRYSPFMRKRLTLLRLSGMIGIQPQDAD